MTLRSLFAAVAAVALVAGPAAGGAATPAEHYTAVALGLGGPRSGSVATRVEMSITRWTTPQQSKALAAALEDGGPDALLEALRRQPPVGTINTPGELAYNLRYAVEEPGEDGGRRILLATDRPVSYWEQVNQPPVADYPITFVELRLDDDGNGVGSLAPATAAVRTSADGRTIELVNYQTQAIGLKDVRRDSR
ncbi:MAG: hypothetical protein AB7H88_20030 [Vicinamibacterales bacterium]